MIDSFGGMGLNIEEFDPACPVMQSMQDVQVSPMLRRHICNYNRCGFKPLREEVVKYVRTCGIETGIENVVIFNGAYEAYNAICSAVMRLDMNTHVLKNDFNIVVKTTQSVGASLVEMDDLNFSELGKKISKWGTDMLHISCASHFPTGVTLDKEERDHVLSVVKKLQLPVIERDSFHDIWKTPPQPLKAGDTNGLIIYIGTFSQLAHTGSFKLAWEIIPKVIRERVYDVSLQIYNTNNILNEVLVYLMLKEGSYAGYISRLSPKIKTRVDTVDRFFHKYLGSRARWIKNYLFIWMELPGTNIDRLFNECGRTILAPVAVYGAPSFINMNTLSETIGRSL